MESRCARRRGRGTLVESRRSCVGGGRRGGSRGVLLSSLLSTRVLVAGEEVPAPAVVCVEVWERIGIGHGMRRRGCVSEGGCQVGTSSIGALLIRTSSTGLVLAWGRRGPMRPHRPQRLRSQAGTPPHRPRAACSASRRCFAPSGFQARGSVQGDLALLLRSRAWTRWWWLPSARRHKASKSSWTHHTRTHTNIQDVRAVTLCDSEAHLTHRVLSLLNTFLRF
jgi:hypothetical protein